MTNTIGATPEERELIERLRKFGRRWNMTGVHAAAALETLISDRAKLRERLDRETSLLRQTLYALHTGRSEPLFIMRDTIRNHLEDHEVNTTKGQSNGE